MCYNCECYRHSTRIAIITVLFNFIFRVLYFLLFIFFSFCFPEEMISLIVTMFVKSIRAFTGCHDFLLYFYTNIIFIINIYSEVFRAINYFEIIVFCWF